MKENVECVEKFGVDITHNNNLEPKLNMLVDHLKHWQHLKTYRFLYSFFDFYFINVG